MGGLGRLDTLYDESELSFKYFWPLCHGQTILGEHHDSGSNLGSACLMGAFLFVPMELAVRILGEGDNLGPVKNRRTCTGVLGGSGRASSAMCEYFGIG